MSAYISINFSPVDPEKLQQYGAAVPATLSNYSGEYVVKGPVELLCGQTEFKMQVILQFPSRAQALAWYNCAEYQALLPLRNAAMHAQFQLIGG
jgi:uncharacterized protein (DUF1330 family)